MTTNTDKIRTAVEALVALVDEDARFEGRSARQVLNSLYDYTTGATGETDYSPAYLNALEAALNIIEGRNSSLPMSALAPRVDDIIAYVDTHDDFFND